MRADDEDGRIRRMATDRREPEIETGMFGAETDVPGQNVDRFLR